MELRCSRRRMRDPRRRRSKAGASREGLTRGMVDVGPEVATSAGLAATLQVGPHQGPAPLPAHPLRHRAQMPAIREPGRPQRPVAIVGSLAVEPASAVRAPPPREELLRGRASRVGASEGCKEAPPPRADALALAEAILSAGYRVQSHPAPEASADQQSRKTLDHFDASDDARSVLAPRPGRLAHHASTVASDHPAVGPTRTSGSGIFP